MKPRKIKIMFGVTEPVLMSFDRTSDVSAALGLTDLSAQDIQVLDGARKRHVWACINPYHEDIHGDRKLLLANTQDELVVLFNTYNDDI